MTAPFVGRRWSWLVNCRVVTFSTSKIRFVIFCLILCRTIGEVKCEKEQRPFPWESVGGWRKDEFQLFLALVGDRKGIISTPVTLMKCCLFNSVYILFTYLQSAIRLPSFDLRRRQWSLLNRFRTGQGHCNACRKKWGFTDNELCDCGETQTMSHIVNFCPLTKFDGGLLRLHEADEAAVNWLTTYSS